MLTISFYAAIQAGCVRAHAWLVCRCSQTSPPVQKPSTFPTSSFFCLNTCGTKTHFAVRRGVVCKLALTNTRRSTLLEGARSTCPAAPTPPTTPANVNAYMQGSTFNAELMALDWCTNSDGLTLFPKLPVHMRLHMEKWKRGERAASHLRGIETHYDVLMDELRAAEPATVEEAVPTTATAASPAPDAHRAAATPRVVVATAHLPMPPVTRPDVEAAAPMLVGRVVIGEVLLPPLGKRKRNARVCRLCWKHGTNAEASAASHPTTGHYGRHCPVFHSTGERKVLA